MDVFFFSQCYPGIIKTFHVSKLKQLSRFKVGNYYINPSRKPKNIYMYFLLENYSLPNKLKRTV